MRGEKLNVDIGLTASRFGFDKDLNNGYFDPTLSQRYGVAIYSYWKISPDKGVSFVLSPGIQKDNTMDHFRFGLDANLEGTFGLYRNWMFKIRAAATTNARQATGAFKAFSGGCAITRRF